MKLLARAASSALLLAVIALTGCQKPDQELLRAVGQGRGAVELAMQRGANIDARDGAGRTPLSHAAALGDAQVVAYLLKHGAKVDEADNDEATPLHWAARGGHGAAIALLLGAHAKVDPVAGLRKRTPLWDAAFSGSADAVNALLQAGADPNKADTFEQTPLHALALIDSARAAQIATMLLAGGARPEVRDARGFTPAHAAAASDNVGLLRVLVAENAQPVVTATTPSSETPLDIALHYQRDRAAEVLLQAGATLRAGARPPLHEAARTDSVERAAALLAMGADVTRRFDGRLPLEVARANNSQRVEQLLLSRKP